MVDDQYNTNYIIFVACLFFLLFSPKKLKVISIAVKTIIFCHKKKIISCFLCCLFLSSFVFCYIYNTYFLFLFIFYNFSNIG